MKPLSQKQLIKAEWVRCLREEGHRQCYLQLWEPIERETPHGTEIEYKPHVRVCALGVLWEILVGRQIIPFWGEPGESDELVEHAGLRKIRSEEVVTMNDFEAKSFAEIADVIEKWED